MRKITVIVLTLVSLTGAFVPLTVRAASISCAPMEFRAYPQRFHVQCMFREPGHGGKLRTMYFAFPLEAQPYHSWSKGAHYRLHEQFLATAREAIASNKALLIDYEPNETRGVAYGCAASDCREIRAIGLRNK